MTASDQTSADDVAAKADDAPFAVDALNKVATESREMARLRETRSPSRLQLEAWATTATKSAGIIEVLRQEIERLTRHLQALPEYIWDQYIGGPRP